MGEKTQATTNTASVRVKWGFIYPLPSQDYFNYIQTSPATNKVAEINTITMFLDTIIVWM